MDPGSMKEEQQVQPMRCSNNCGFFANPNCGDMCSKCSREMQASQAQAAKAMAVSAPQHPPQPIQQQADAAAASVPTPEQPAVEATPAANLSTAASDPPAAPVPAASVAAEPAPVNAPAPPTPMVQQPQAAELAPAPSPIAAIAAACDDDSPEPPRRVQKHTNRCFSCNKKVGLTGFKCRCGFVFCGPHRLAEAHACDFDYKATGREHLAKANPLIQADRVQRF